jgi:hypothetical protein
MAGEVKIKITATDDATDEIKQVNKELDNLGEAATDAGEALESGVGRIDKLMQIDAVREFGRAAKKAFDQVSEAVRGMVTEYADYAEQVRDLSRLTGQTTELSSQLIQVADDVKIGYEQLSTAMEAATRQGIDVSIDGLMRLADQYNALAPGVERSEWLLKTFGRSGADMAQLLEVGSEGIRNMSDEINQSLVLTQQQVDAVREAEIAYDNFNDSIMAVRMEITGNLIGAFNSLPKPIKNTAMALAAFGPQIAGGISTIADLTIALQGLGTLFKAGGLLAGIPAMARTIGSSLVAIGAAAGPIGLLVGAVAGLIALLNSSFGQRGITALKQLAVLWANMIYGQSGAKWAMNITGLDQRASGGPVTAMKPYLVGEKGPEMFIPANSGTIIPNSQMALAGNNGGSVIFNYNPAVSFASRSEAEMVLKPIIENLVRSRYGNG